MAEGLIIKSGVSKFSSGINKTSGQSSFQKQQSVKVGKVMGVVTTNNTPTSKQFEKVSGY